MSSASVALDLPIHVLLSALAPLCLPWIWKQACRPFPLLHYHIQRGERGEREREEAQDWIKRKGTPSLPHPDFFIGLSIYITSVLCSVSLFPCCLDLDLKGANCAFRGGQRERRMELLFMHRKRGTQRVAKTCMENEDVYRVTMKALAPEMKLLSVWD